MYNNDNQNKERHSNSSKLHAISSLLLRSHIQTWKNLLCQNLEGLTGKILEGSPKRSCGYIQTLIYMATELIKCLYI